MATPGVVWVKLGRTWWPAEVTNDFPPDVTVACRKTPLAVVKFFNENTYQVITSANQMIEYRDEKRVELIKKGLVHLKGVNSKNEKENFITDLKHAEKLTGGKEDEIDELSKSVDAPTTPKRPIYADIFKAPPKEPPPPATPPSAIKFNFKKAPKPPVSPRKEAYSSSTPQKPGPPKKYACDICGFSSDRVGVMTSHRKIHSSVDYSPTSSGSPRKNPVVSAVSDAALPSTSGTNTKVSPIKPKTETPKKEVKDKVTPVKRGRKKKIQPKEDILNDWSDEEEELPSKKHTEDLDETAAPLMKKPRTDKELSDAFEALLQSTQPPTIDAKSKEMIKEEPPAKFSDETHSDEDEKNHNSPLHVPEKDSNLDNSELVDKTDEYSVDRPNVTDIKADEEEHMIAETTAADQSEEKIGERTDLKGLKEVHETSECQIEENANESIEEANEEKMEIDKDQSQEMKENVSGQNEEVDDDLNVKESAVEESQEAKESEEMRENKEQEESITNESIENECTTGDVAKSVRSEFVTSDTTADESAEKEESNTDIKEITFESTELDSTGNNLVSDAEFNKAVNTFDDVAIEDADTEPEEEDFVRTAKHSEAEPETTVEQGSMIIENLEKEEITTATELSMKTEEIETVNIAATLHNVPITQPAQPTFSSPPNPSPVSKATPKVGSRRKSSLATSNPPYQVFAKKSEVEFQIDEKVIPKKDTKISRKKAERESQLEKQNHLHELEKANKYREIISEQHSAVKYVANSEIQASLNGSSLNNMIPEPNASFQSFEEKTVVANTSLHTSQTNKSDDFAARLDAIIAVVDSVQRTDTEQVGTLAIQGSSEQQLPVAIKEPEKVLPKPQTDGSTYNFPKELPIAVKSAPVLVESSLPRKDAAGKSPRKATKREPKSAASKAPSLVATEKNAEKKVYPRKKSNPMTPSNKPVVAESIPPKEPIVNIKGVEKPTATIRPTLNIEDDSIIRQALQGTIKSSPESQPTPNSRPMEVEVEGERSIVAIEEGGGTKVAEQVVHLVPVENPDGTVTYMLLSLGGQGELCIDAAEGAAPTIEEGAIFMDKTTDADTFFASITQPNAPTSIVQTSVSQKVTQPFKQNVGGATHSNANNQVMLQNQLQGVQILQSNQPSNELIQITQQVDGGSLIEVAAGSSGATQAITSATPAMLDLASLGLIAGTGGAQIQSGEQQFVFLTEDGSIINSEGFNLSDFMISS